MYIYIYLGQILWNIYLRFAYTDVADNSNYKQGMFQQSYYHRTSCKTELSGNNAPILILDTESITEHLDWTF